MRVDARAIGPREAGLGLRAFLNRAATVAAQILREIFDESAYERFLRRRGTGSSRAAYAEFLREGGTERVRRPRCC